MCSLNLGWLPLRLWVCTWIDCLLRLLCVCVLWVLFVRVVCFGLDVCCLLVTFGLTCSGVG